MIARIYGMNFEHMPELRWTFGYPLVLGVIAVLCGILFWRFRKSGWLWASRSPARASGAGGRLLRRAELGRNP